ncbi:formyltetrahydrofolate deformylase [Thermasporomyces composti]|jgi:formyltetrahydrofolate deformylase|uniref:Formyltetrahydrofolate deformylase n=1 Tax=Thermasporomyces composti TaxID=696763 RepID=A0A3D9V086_THECX|nr:formyltetrahydrofolate deformylase [Thermasporomyces composti]REF35168.1 formyltetrahydrofolate deformylase [Thermasporomyces composti]
MSTQVSDSTTGGSGARASSSGQEYVLTLSCMDRLGIVHAVSGFLAERGCNIVDSQQFSDPINGRFFMRVHVQAGREVTLERLQAEFAPVGAAWGMEWQLHDLAVRQRILVLVSKQDHCLNDLLYRCRVGAIPGDIVAVVSNHPNAGPMVESVGLPFYHFPVTPETKREQEEKILRIVEEYQVDLVVLARYMQVLSKEMCEKLVGRAINIHHSFLPSFAGARPYHQAYERGVKLIGATAHYVTEELDEGPIIEQEVARVDHSLTPAKLAAVGRDLECLALARAVTWHLEHRVILNGTRTVVFR